MRVRPQRQTGRRRLALRRPHAVDHLPGAAPAPATVEGPAPPTEDDPAGGAVAVEPLGGHVAEARHRASVRPEDQALYRCACGYQFEASVSASVACPHCGSGQAW